MLMPECLSCALLLPIDGVYECVCVCKRDISFSLSDFGATFEIEIFLTTTGNTDAVSLLVFLASFTL